MVRGYTKSKVLVHKIGKPEDYVNLPVVKNEVAVGVVSKAVEVEAGYELTLTMFVRVEYLSDSRPNAIIIN